VVLDFIAPLAVTLIVGVLSVIINCYIDIDAGAESLSAPITTRALFSSIICN